MTVQDHQDFLGLTDDQMDTLIAEASGWLSDVFADYRHGEYPPRQILRFIDANYDGATRQFADDIAPLLERTEA